MPSGESRKPPPSFRRRPESTRHSGEGRNPVVYLIHPRPGGDDHPLSGAATLKRQGRIQHPGNPCLDSGFRRNDDQAIDACRQPYSFNPCPSVIYGQEVLYAASGREARAARRKPEATPVIYGQEVLYAARGQEARSRPAKATIHPSFRRRPESSG